MVNERLTPGFMYAYRRRVGGSQVSPRGSAADIEIPKAQMLGVRSESVFSSAFAEARETGAEALLLTPNPVLDIGGQSIAALALQHRWPAMSFSEFFPRAGGLISYGPNVAAVYKRSAYYVGRILAGTHPSELPIEQPTKFNLVINLSTAKALDVKVPDILLASADEVID
jgi:putative tryptophan/tyrosine transport system substrate-binding protein